jgi:ribosomal-protein-serine acetyltransferase
MTDLHKKDKIIKDDPTYSELNIDSDLRLKQLDVSQAEYLFELTEKDREYLSKWLPWPNKTHSSKDSRIFIESIIQKRKNKEEYGFGIEFEKNLVGHISLIHLKDVRDPEIGYWISSNYAGKGITTKAVTALTQFGFNTLKLKKIIIRANPDNIASNKVAKKVGYLFSHQTEDKGELLNVWEILT